MELARGKEGGKEGNGPACPGPIPSLYHFSPSSSHTLSPLNAYGIGVEQTKPYGRPPKGPREMAPGLAFSFQGNIIFPLNIKKTSD